MTIRNGSTRWASTVCNDSAQITPCLCRALAFWANGQLGGKHWPSGRRDPPLSPLSLSELAQGSAEVPQQPAGRDTRQSEPDTFKLQAAAKRKWPLIVVLAVLQSSGGGVLSELVLTWLASLSGG